MNFNVNVLVIDDEALARKRVVRLLKDFDEITILSECRNGQEAIENINKGAPDIIFLDIQMKDMNGFDVLAQIDPERLPLVIFITAYDQFAINAFDVFAFDYLLKPFENSRFNKSVKNALEYLRKDDFSKYNVRLNELLKYISDGKKEEPIFADKFPVKIGNKINFIKQSDIKYVLASGSYPEMHTITKKIPLRDSLNNLIKFLDSSKFIRIHRSVIINVDFIQELVHSSYYELDIKMADNELFRVSKSYRKIVVQKLGLR